MRTRNLKPAFFKNDILGGLDPLARLLFSGLWCMADREGRLEDRPLRIKAELLPFDDCNVDDLLSLLDENGFIKRYSSGKEKYIQILTFIRHQHPHMKEPESEIPSPEEASRGTEEVEDKPEKPHNGTALSNAPDKHRASPALNLKPYTLNLKPQTEVSEEAAEAVLNYFCNASGKSYRDKKSRIAPIKRTLSKGFTQDEMNTVTDRMVAEWQGTKYEKLLNPSTLFGDRFEEYLTRAPLMTKKDKSRFSDYESHNDYSESDIEKLFNRAPEIIKSAP